ncbi:MAG: methylmalonyl Co-A mutase-associated GTPase MeaB [Planctomycetota bacterium]|nr:MAG: methylmalonyl Co-A mutase-associated GTPase MeaB [Planctomycetota bacterium]
MTVTTLLKRFDAGHQGALARAISWVENGNPEAGELLDALHARTGSAQRTGITGPPGAGKSTLVDALASHWAAAGRKLGLLAVDPSSPFSGGALLGDRIRMDRASGEHGVFVRSMATRGSLGGLALATGAAADLMDAFGFEEILLETVGVGQAEIDIAAATDVCVVVLTPQSGDGVQAMKAGLMEAADLFVVNKADQGGADLLCGELEQMLDFRPADAIRPPVLKSTASKAVGIAEIATAIDELRAHSAADGRAETRRHERKLARTRRVFVEILRAALWSEHGLEQLAQSQLDSGARPDRVAQKLASDLINRFHQDGEQQ